MSGIAGLEAPAGFESQITLPITDLVLVSVSAPQIKPIMLIRYMWSAMLSGWRTPRFTQPVRFVL